MTKPKAANTAAIQPDITLPDDDQKPMTTTELYEALETIQDELERVEAERDSLKTENETLKTEVERLRAAPTTGRSGWIVKTPYAGFNGVTAGVVFRNGTALIPDNADGARLAREMEAEFGYAVSFVTDYLAPEEPAAAQVSKSLVDTLMTPARR